MRFESVALANIAILWPGGIPAFRSDPSALAFPHPSGDPDRAVALVYSSDGGASSNDGGRTWQTVGYFGRLSPRTKDAPFAPICSTRSKNKLAEISQNYLAIFTENSRYLHPGRRNLTLRFVGL